MKTNYFKLLKSSLMVLFLGLGLSSWGQTTTWTKLTNHTDVTSTGTYMIVDVSSNHALTSANGTGAAPAAVDVTITGGDTITGTISEDLQWTFETSGSGYIIRPVNNQSVALNSTSSNNGVRVNTSTNNVWELNQTGSEGYKGFINTSYNRYIGVYDNQDWRTYTSIHANIVNTQIEIFQLEEAPTGDHTITVTQPTGGEITPETTGVNNGDSASFTATPESSCYVFSHWVVDGVDVGNTNPYQFTNVTADHTITAIFNATSTYEITATAGANGSISPSGAVEVNCGADQAFTITADSGYAVADVLVNGVSAGAVTAYTFENVTENQAISASFIEFTGPCVEEDFSGIANSNNYGTKTWTGSGGTWTATDAREDQTINGKAITIRNGVLTSPEFTSGVSSITMTTKLPFSDTAGNLVVKVNDIEVGTIPYSSATTTSTISNVNIGGNIIVTVHSSGARVAIDDLEWTCYSATPSAVTWTGTEWINGVPSITEDLIIAGDFNTSTNGGFEAQALTVQAGSSFTIAENTSITVQGAITNEGNFTIEAGGNLIQNDDDANTGAITVMVEAQTEWFGYNMFSSPVAGQTFAGFSDNGSEVYTYDYANPDGWTPASGGFVEGEGYLFAAPYTGFPQGELTTFFGEFVGVPHNGAVSVNVAANSFVSLGNPYPSAIDADELLDANSNIGTLYFWTNAHFYDTVTSAYPGNNYATYTLVGGVGTGEQAEAGGNATFPTPNEAIQTGQGFIAGITTGGTVTFDNTMRFATGGTFYKVMEEDKHRLWLSLADQNNELNQILVGYMEGASQGVDTGIDGPMFGYDGSALYSLIENSDANYVIQGRYPFATADVVPLGFRAIEGGSYTISLANFDGLFAEGQDIFLKDNLNNSTIDLKEGDYTFVSNEGIFDDRFEITYNSTLSVNNPTLDNNWAVYKQDGSFQILSQGFDIKEVTVFDMLGRTLYQSDVEGASHQLPQMNANGVLIIKVVSTDNGVSTKKVIN